MKKFLFGIISLVVLLFIGFSTYYVVRDNETVAYTVSDKETIYVNIGEVFESPVIHEHKAKNSVVNVSLSNNNLVYDDVRQEFTASKVGSTTVTCVPSKSKFSAITFTVKIGNGSVNNPFYIRNQADLNKVGKTSTWTLSSSYELVEDITLTEALSPIGDANSLFIGNFFGGEVMHKISNINIASDKNVGGFFGGIGASARIERIVFENISVNGSFDYAGAIAGINYGFIGQCEVLNAVINNSRRDAYTGGVVGLNKSLGAFAQLTLVTFSGSISAQGYIGGFVGKSEGGVVDNCYGKVSALLISRDSVFGGIAGFNTYSNVVINDLTKYINSKYLNNIIQMNNVSELGKYYTAIGKSVVLSSMPTSFTYYDMILACSAGSYSPIGEHGNDYGLTTDNSSSVGYYANISPEDLTNRITFTGVDGSIWDFKDFWAINNSDLLINYEHCAGSYPILPERASVNTELSTVASVKTAIQLLRDYPGANLEFKIVKNLLIDFEGATFEPIGSIENPFVGKLTAADDVTVRIRNFNIVTTQEYAGFFGVIQGNDTLIKNIEFMGGTYQGSCIGGIAGYNNGATIENCSTESFTMKATNIAGGVVGFNNGNIVGGGANIGGGYCIIEADESSGQDLTIGIVVGENRGHVTDVEASMVNVSVYSESDKPIYIGGIIGKQNGGVVSGVSNYNLNITADKLKGVSYCGGLVGYMDGGVLENSFISGYKASLSFASDKAISGGLVGFLGENAEIVSCLFDNGNVTAKRVAGIVGLQYGEVNKCAVMANVILDGYYAGGLSYDCHGILRNSYSLATLKGSSIEAGFVVYLNTNASVRYCYNYCSYTGTGDAYCETATKFRSDKANREFKNNIVVGRMQGGDGILGDTFVTKVYGRDDIKTVKIQTRMGYNKGSFTIVSQDVALGTSSFVEFSKAGFDSNIWNIYGVSGEEGQYLTLKDLPEIPVEE